MKTKKILVILTIAFLFIVASYRIGEFNIINAQQFNTVAPFYTYVNQLNHFSLSFPSYWERNEGRMGTIVMALSPLESQMDTFRENVNVVNETLSQPMNVEQYFQANLPSMQSMLQNFSIVEVGSGVINGFQTKWMVYQHSMNNMNLKAIVYFFVYNNFGYCITLTSLVDQFDRFRNLFVQIANTFRFF